MHGSHFQLSLAWSFLFSLLRPFFLACRGRASVTATSLSFLEVFGLPTLFSLNCLANCYQYSSQVRWRACHAWFVFGTLGLVFFFSLLFSALSRNARYPSADPHDLTHIDGGFWAPGVFWRCPLWSTIEACAARLCSHTFSVGLTWTQEPQWC